MKSELSRLRVRYALAMTGAFVLYNGISRLWIGANEWGVHQFTFEFPLYFLVMGFLFFPQIPSAWIREGVPPFVYLALYFLFDSVYLRLHRAPELSDFRELPGIFEFSPGTGILILACLGSIPAIVFLLGLCASRHTEDGWFRKSFFLRCLGLTCLGLLLSPVLNPLHETLFVDRSWSQERSIRYNGRISYFLFHQKRARQWQERIEAGADREKDVSRILFPGSISSPRNIHMIVLESFLDPRRLTGIRFSRSPVAEELMPYLDGGQFPLARSPVYGGGTAQAEFELLTGIPALRRLATPEFNFLRGREVNAFVARLRENGYDAIGTIASSHEYYNSIPAYRSLGLSPVEFPDNNPRLREAPGDHYLFDGDLFSRHLGKLEEHRTNRNRPVFTYLLGMYGHFPHHRNTELRPDRVELEGGSPELVRLTNQFYYRSQALGRFLNKIFTSDPDCLVCITSDHAPFVDEKRLDPPDPYLNSTLLLDRGDLVDVSGLPYYRIPWKIWDLLTGREPARDVSPSELEKLYFELLRESRLDPAP